MSTSRTAMGMTKTSNLNATAFDTTSNAMRSPSQLLNSTGYKYFDKSTNLVVQTDREINMKFHKKRLNEIQSRKKLNIKDMNLKSKSFQHQERFARNH